MALGKPQPWLAMVAAGLLLVACRDDSGSSDTARAPAAAPSARGRPSMAPRGIATRPLASADLDPVATAGEEGAEVQDVDEPVTDGDADCAPSEPKLKPLQLLRFRFTSGVESRDPVDQLHVARPGQRVWAHFRVRNRSGRSRCLRVTFRINGQARTRLKLEVGESWNWRTWAYATLREGDRSGAVEVEAVDDQGNVVADRRLPIVPKSP